MILFLALNMYLFIGFIQARKMYLNLVNFVCTNFLNIISYFFTRNSLFFNKNLKTEENRENGQNRYNQMKCNKLLEQKFSKLDLIF